MAFAEENPQLVKLLDPTVSQVHRYFTESGVEEFCGSATELAERMEATAARRSRRRCSPKWLLCGHAQFCSLGYTCSFYRTHEGKKIKITRAGNCDDAATS